MIRLKNTSILLLVSCLFLCACGQKNRFDLSTLTFKEKAADIIDYKDKYFGGVSTVDAPLAFALQANKSSSFAYNDIKIDSADITFFLRSDKIRKDTSLYQGGASINQIPIKDGNSLNRTLNKFQADSVIYGYRLSVKKKELQSVILKQLIASYGQGTKNPNTEHGLYWNLKNLHRFVFFDPDYQELFVIDNTHLSKNCFWDPTIGTVDFGGCNIDEYKTNLLK